MKPMRYLLATSVLASALSMPAFAGTIHTGAPEPQPVPTPATAEGEMPTSGGDIHTGYSEEATAEETVVGGALGLLQGVLSLL